MAKIRTFYSCQACGHQETKWMGRCPACQEWGSLVEETEAPVSRGGGGLVTGGSTAKPLKDVTSEDSPRAKTGLAEFDRVLGGGVVAGSAILVGGPPGIGKSTLLLQAMHRLSTGKAKSLYVSAEESEKQVKMRADRIHCGADNLYVLGETSLEAIFNSLEKLKPAFVVIDSIQTVYSGLLESAPGSVSQVRDVASRLTAHAKHTGTAMFLVGHVTKEGSIAGPRVVEHVVDTVLYFEETGGHAYRILHAAKNRFGSTNELGVFRMEDRGLTEVANPSELFLAERPKDAAGSVVLAAVEGTRPLLVEAQALVSKSSLGTPRRTALGIDPQRATLLVAILEKKAGLALSDLDVYINVAGGVRIREPAADLSVAVAVASSILDRPVDSKTVVFGELGLAGEVRAVSQAESRLKEAAKLGFTRCVLPAASAKGLRVAGIETIGVSTVDEALRVALPKRGG